LDRERAFRRVLLLRKQHRLVPADRLHAQRPAAWPAKRAYHRESNQEDFLVLAGTCLLLVEGEERRLSAGDVFHCPPDCEHILVGDGDAPCVVFMTGSRTREKEIVYPRSELALRHGAGVQAETARPADAYAALPKWESAPAPSELPWR
jgi:uncharacterized cupin superfamily protein